MQYKHGVLIKIMDYKLMAEKLRKITKELRVLNLEQTKAGRLQLSIEKSCANALWFGDYSFNK